MSANYRSFVCCNNMKELKERKKNLRATHLLVWIFTANKMQIIFKQFAFLCQQFHFGGTQKS